MRGTTDGILQHYRILRLPRKLTLQTFTKISRKQLKRHFQCGTDPSRIRAGNRHSATRLATEVTFHAHHEHFVLKNTTFRAPAIIPNFTKYCACHEKWHFNFTKYCACHAKWLSWSILVTHETLFTMREATSVIVQTHQILRLPRKMNLMIDPCHTCDAIYNARSNKCHCPNSPNTAPATKNESHDWSLSHMRRYLQCAEQQVSLSKLTKYCACHAKWNSWLISMTYETLFTMRGTTGNRWHPPTSPNTAPATQNDCHDWSSSHMKRYLQCAEQQVASSNITKYRACHAKWFSKISAKFLQNRWNVIYNARPIRDHSELDPTMKPSSATRLATEVTFHDHHDLFVLKITTFRAPAIILNFTEYCACHEKWHLNFTKYCACHAKWLASFILMTCHTSFTMRSATALTLRPHQILRLPRKMKLMIDQHDIWNAIYNARNNRQQVASSNITKYCACHAKWLSWLILVTYETLFTMCGTTGGILQHHQILRLPRKMILQNFSEISPKQMKRHLQCATDPRPFRAGSDHETVIRNPPRNRGYFSRPPRAFCIEKYNLSRSGYHSKFHRILRLPRKVTLQLHQILRLPRKMTLMINPRHTWNAIYNARRNKCHCPNSPNTAPATKNESHDWSLSHMKRYLQCAEQQVSLSKLTKYCACHEKRISWLILVTHETLFTMRGTTGGILQHHQILRLPGKMILQNFSKISPKQMKRHLQCATDPRPSREWSELDPSWIRPWNRHPQPASQPRLLFTPTTSILYWKIQHFALRLSFQSSPNTAPATKSDTSTSPNTAPATKSDTWTSPNSAPATKSNTWTSPNNAPATKSDTWTPPNSAPATKSHTTLLYSSLVFATILLRISTLLFSSIRYYSLTNLFSNESNLLRI